MPEANPIHVPDDLIPAPVELTDAPDGNAFSILAHVTRALRAAGNSANVIDDYRDQATSGDYEQLLRVSIAFTESAS